MAFELLQPAPAGAAETYEVRLGAQLTAPVPAESMRFLPGSLQVHPGDTIHFTSQTVHNLTLLPAGYDVDTFLASDWTGTSSAWSPFIDDADEGDNALKLNPRLLPTFVDCGSFGQEACTYDADTGLGPISGGTSIPNAGSPLDFTIEVTASAGASFTAVDLLFPDLRMDVQVVDATQTIPSPAEVSDEADDQIAVDQATASTLHAKYSKQKPKKGKGAKTVWTVRPGVDEAGVSLRSFYPAKLTIRPKQRVKWAFSGLTHSSATVTFPAARGLAIAGAFPEFVCDTDGQGTASDSAPTFASAPYCDDPEQLEIDVPHDLPYGAGNKTVTSAKDFEHSGIRGAGFAPTATDYVLRFTKKSTKKGFSYVSIGGAIMTGKVVVK
jgi:plastocyanin